MRHLYSYFLLTVIALLLIPLPAMADDYRLAPDDVIEMNIWGEPDLSKQQLQITSEGYITLPFLNKMIKATGLTQTELAQKIADEYAAAEILVEPKVQVNLPPGGKHPMQVWVLGQVQRPGVVLFREGDTLTTAIAQSGSYTPDARLETATLTHRGADKQITLDLRRLYNEGDLSQDYKLQEGDVIFIPEDTYNRYYVLGEVYKPGLYFLKDNASVLSAISIAGGATERGSLKATTLIRGDINNPEKRTVDIGKVLKGDLSQDVKLQAGDVVYVPETNKPDWGKISQILGVLTSVGYIRRFGIF